MKGQKEEKTSCWADNLSFRWGEGRAQKGSGGDDRGLRTFKRDMNDNGGEKSCQKEKWEHPSFQGEGRETYFTQKRKSKTEGNRKKESGGGKHLRMTLTLGRLGAK